MITETPILMSGIFKEYAEEFIKFKQSQGYKYYSESKMLHRFCQFTQQFHLNKPEITEEIVRIWLTPRDGEREKTRMHRFTCLNQFSIYLKQRGVEVAKLPHKSKWEKSDFIPYIFTRDEISSIFHASDAVKATPQSKNMHKMLPVLIRLLYGTGLRVSESVKLLCSDVDLNKGILTIRQAKNMQDRIVPLSSSLLKYCSDYRINVIPWANEDDYFFMAPNRTILSPNTVYSRFRRILWDGKIPYKGKGNGPRLHDLRHTFAVHTLQKWSNNGEDIYSLFPILSTYLGHSSLNATAQYLRLTSEVYPEIIEQIEKKCSFVIPKTEDLL